MAGKGPKQKSHRGAAKRFRVSATGKYKHRHAFRSHNFEGKNAKRRRTLRRDAVVDARDSRRLKRLLPYD
ncbi:MAG: 50S ribosomal protein L35 [Firmicutes bacterium]|nr:50S ribosomal protein L35 [Bacillota bacterium]